MHEINYNIEEEIVKNRNMRKYILTVSAINTLLVIGAIVILLVKTCCG